MPVWEVSYKDKVYIENIRAHRLVTATSASGTVLIFEDETGVPVAIVGHGQWGNVRIQDDSFVP